MRFLNGCQLIFCLSTNQLVISGLEGKYIHVSIQESSETNISSPTERWHKPHSQQDLKASLKWNHVNSHVKNKMLFVL